jgi:hypothetical protein
VFLLGRDHVAVVIVDEAGSKSLSRDFTETPRSARISLTSRRRRLGQIARKPGRYKLGDAVNSASMAVETMTPFVHDILMPRTGLQGYANAFAAACLACCRV